MIKSRSLSSVVLIATRNQSLRTRWRADLEPLFVVQVVSSLSVLHRAINRTNPSVLLLDLDLLDGAAAKGIEALIRISPSTKILAFSRLSKEKEASTVLKAGAKGYCDIHMDLMLLRKAVQMVQKGEVWIERRIVAFILNELAFRPVEKLSITRAELKKLTLRELQVAYEIGAGASNKEIASQLNITEATVKAHLTSIFLKLGVADRLALALYMVRAPVTTESNKNIQ